MPVGDLRSTSLGRSVQPVNLSCSAPITWYFCDQEVFVNSQGRAGAAHIYTAACPRLAPLPRGLPWSLLVTVKPNPAARLRQICNSAEWERRDRSEAGKDDICSHFWCGKVDEFLRSPTLPECVWDKRYIMYVWYVDVSCAESFLSRTFISELQKSIVCFHHKAVFNFTKAGANGDRERLGFSVLSPRKFSRILGM